MKAIICMSCRSRPHEVGEKHVPFVRKCGRELQVNGMIDPLNKW